MVAYSLRVKHSPRCESCRFESYYALRITIRKNTAPFFIPDKCYGSTAVSKTVSGGSTPSSGAIYLSLMSPQGRNAVMRKTARDLMV